MKTRNLLLGAFGLLLMASCTKDEVVNINRDGDEIAFNVVTNAGTRVLTDTETGYGGVYCNLNMPREFNVWATTADDSKDYIVGDIVENVGQTGQNMLAQANQSPQEVLQNENPEKSTNMTIQHNLDAINASWNWRNHCLRYWPGNQHVNFYAVVDAPSSGDPNYKFNWNNTNSGTFTAPTISVTIPTDVTKQKDLLYAVKLDQYRDQYKTEASNSEESNSEESESEESTERLSSGSQVNNAAKTHTVVNLNFRHALSQIVFTTQNPNEKLKVIVKGVSICNVNDQNTFTYPSKNTDPNLDDGHLKLLTGLNNAGAGSGSSEIPTDPTQPSNDGTWGTWGTVTPAAAELKDYALTFDPIEIPPVIKDSKGAVITEDPVISLSGPLFERTYKTGEKDKDGKDIEKTDTYEYYTNAMLLLPQKTVAWDPKAETYKNPGDNTQAGTYFLVDCFIGNIANGDTFKPGEDVVVWGNVENTNAGTEGAEANWVYTTKKVAIPVALNWKQGKKYVYNFVFGAFGGYNPDEPEPNPNPNPEDPDLVPIMFSLTVDEFGAVGTNSGVAESTIRDTDMAGEMTDYGKQE